MPASKPDRKAAPMLVPKCPPGRSSRKARAFATEIGRLHALGYTLDTIREALAEVGVQVSKSTVQREAARHAAQAATTLSTRAAAPPPQPSPPRVPVAAQPPTPVTGPHGKDIAEAFVAGRNTNPLLRAKDSR